MNNFAREGAPDQIKQKPGKAASYQHALHTYKA
jgi:hypothetical protein